MAGGAETSEVSKIFRAETSEVSKIFKIYKFFEGESFFSKSRKVLGVV